ncbi:MAG TPA: hypothetical protein VJ743_10945 [Albitalea sp.]|nr:hypothetical protein [Albitalea sp.]
MTRSFLPWRRRPRPIGETPPDDLASSEAPPSRPPAPGWRSHPVELAGDTALNDFEASSWFGDALGA